MHITPPSFAFTSSHSLYLHLMFDGLLVLTRGQTRNVLILMNTAIKRNQMNFPLSSEPSKTTKGVLQFTVDWTGSGQCVQQCVCGGGDLNIEVTDAADMN